MRTRAPLTIALILATFVAAPAVAVAPTAKRHSGVIRGAHDCVPRAKADRGDARVAWKQLKNPILAIDTSTKDQGIRLVDGTWHLFYSDRQPNGAALTSHSTSTDLTSWESEPLFPGAGSPDITHAADGRYVITAQVRDAVNDEISRLHYFTASDPNGAWTPATRLTGLFEDERTIDGAIAHTRFGLFVLFKRGLHDSTQQNVHLAWSPSGSLDGPWESLGEPDLPWSENFQFLVIGGVWHVLVTTIPVHHPTLFRLVGNPANEKSWLHWKKVRQLEVPQESWNKGRTPGITHETANSAYLCDARRLDGYWYLLYAGSTELETFDGRGHAKIGIARSKDLVHWKVPPR